ncbi:glycosyltransferase [Subtercola endophyticus]|uniref:glycosyltransferase n=1 Tax=Subtercola endophyticus TaxID=2895559 RepID=UPI001E41C1E8|nr:glycosyltransferase [Subtercola endophyticus]UFS57741.1 glycosyltransferase [Subtercola endophyticus]
MSKAVVLTRLGVLATTVLGRDPGLSTPEEYARVLAPAVNGDTNLLWLTQAAIAAVLPLHDDFERFRRDAALNGAAAAIGRQVARSSRVLAPNRSVQIRIATDTVIVDVHHTARTGLATGIQRVVRQTIQQWNSKAEVELVGWDSSFTGLRHLSEPERQNALYGSVPRIARPREWVLTIPFRTTYILPELAIEQGRTDRISCLAEFSGNQTTVIGFDCVPLTSSETVGEGMSAAFAKNLSALAHFDRVSTISRASATEYAGWKRMLSGAGLAGPEIEPLLLPSVAEEVSADDFERAREQLLSGQSTGSDAPLVVCVGSHEPRKNHLAVLYAAERLWLEGVSFQLVFIGGNGWNGAAFAEQLARLTNDGWPVKAISAVSDSLLWSAYRLAYLTVFPSLNEGFGLPVGESLSAGTPVVTSGFGSMKEIAAAGGAIFVDPRDDDDVYRGMRAGLLDEELHARLVAEAAELPSRGWSDYAAALWQYFVPQSVAPESERPASVT